MNTRVSFSHTQKERSEKKNITGCLTRLNIQKINLIIRTNNSVRVRGALTRLLGIVGEKTETNEGLIYAANPQSIQTGKW